MGSLNRIGALSYGVFQILISMLMIYSCQSKVPKPVENADSVKESRRIEFEFNDILDADGVFGSVLIYDLNQDVYYSNDFERSDSGFIPASTFKIPNSLIALETGLNPYKSDFRTVRLNN